MIPLRDRNPSGAFPLITLSLILVNTFVFLYELQLGPAASFNVAATQPTP